MSAINLLSQFQSAYPPEYSTETDLLKMVNDLLPSFLLASLHLSPHSILSIITFSFTDGRTILVFLILPLNGFHHVFLLECNLSLFNCLQLCHVLYKLLLITLIISVMNISLLRPSFLLVFFFISIIYVHLQCLTLAAGEWRLGCGDDAQNTTRMENWKRVSGILCDRRISLRVNGKVYKTVV